MSRYYPRVKVTGVENYNSHATFTFIAHLCSISHGDGTSYATIRVDAVEDLFPLYDALRPYFENRPAPAAEEIVALEATGGAE